MLTLKCHRSFPLGERRGLSRQIDVVDDGGLSAGPYVLMCGCIDDDVQSAKGSGASVLDCIRKVESGEASFIEADGNAWIANISRDRVTFEGFYGQGEGGLVSLAQFKLAVETYCRFLEDPEHKSIEVPFPTS